MSIVADTYHLKAETVAKEIKELLEDESFSQKAAFMSRISQNSGVVSEAADLIERYLAIGSNEYNVHFDNDWPWWKQQSLDVFCFIGVILLFVALTVLMKCLAPQSGSESRKEHFE